jgi:hypothetical protein
VRCSVHLSNGEIRRFGSFDECFHSLFLWPLIGD